ncbi:MAG: tetratricopeptide repeat protein [Terriglobia bacterium]
MGDTILAGHFLSDESQRPSGTEVVLVKAHAGAGKSVLLRRIAWDAARDYDKLCLFLKPHGVIGAGPLQELAGLCRERIYVFVDDSADHVRELQSLLKNIGPEGKLLTILLAERINEWNILGDPVSPYVTSEYELKYLSSREIDALLGLLEHHGALHNLEALSQGERRAAFADRAGRQLLVALHEATLGLPFEEILVDEFNHISPLDAQQMYLSICLLNRLNVPVRAGIIARIHGIAFEDFRSRLFAPLDHVVLAEYDEVIRDFNYRTRHPHIADIVFARILSNVRQRYEAYVRCLEALNVSYSTDERAFWQMIRARTLIELFPEEEMVKNLFALARKAVGEEPHLLHQMGLYEMKGAAVDLEESARLLNRAMELAPFDETIKHSLAELRMRQADAARTPLEREVLLKEAADLSRALIKDEKTDSYAHHTLTKIGLRKLRDAMEAGEAEAGLEKHIKEVELELSEGLQRFPGDEYLLESERQLAILLSDSERVFKSLQKAFAANRGSPVVALRLARLYSQRDHNEEAKTVLKEALEANRTDRRLHFAYATILRRSPETSNEELIYHLQRSFTEGDSNYDAQLLYGRQLFIAGNLPASQQVFRRLRTARVPPETRHKLLYPIDGVFTGRVAGLEASYCFVTRDGTNDSVYAHSANIKDDVWSTLTFGSRVSFRIGFTMSGANAFNLKLIA